MEGKVPDDASVLIVAGPTSEPFPNELDFIDAYLNKGGSALIMVDPSPGASLSDFLKKWSIDVGNNIVLDASGVGRLFGAGPSIPLVTNYGRHKITERFNTMTFFRWCGREAADASGRRRHGGGVVFLQRTQLGRNQSEVGGREVRRKCGHEGPVPLAAAVTKNLSDNKKPAWLSSVIRTSRRMASSGRRVMGISFSTP